MLQSSPLCQRSVPTRLGTPSAVRPPAAPSPAPALLSMLHAPSGHWAGTLHFTHHFLLLLQSHLQPHPRPPPAAPILIPLASAPSWPWDCLLHAAVRVPLALPMAIAGCPLGPAPLSPPAVPLRSALILGTVPHPLRTAPLSLTAILVPLASPAPLCPLGPSPFQGVLLSANPARLPLPALL